MASSVSATHAGRLTQTRVGAVTPWVSIVAGGQYALGLRADGALWTWGHNADGQLGVADGDTTDRYAPTQVGGSVNWSTVAAGQDHSLGMRADGSLWTWGNNWHGQLGLGVNNITSREVPELVATIYGWKAVAGGTISQPGLPADMALSGPGAIIRWTVGSRGD